MPANPPLPNLVESAHALNVENLKWYIGVITEPVPTRKGELNRQICFGVDRCGDSATIMGPTDATSTAGRRRSRL